MCRYNSDSTWLPWLPAEACVDTTPLVDEAIDREIDELYDDGTWGPGED